MNKIILKRSWFIKAPREDVYRIMSDFENMPKYFPKVAESVKIVKRNGNDLTIEAQVRSFGRTFTTHMQTQLRPPEGYISDNKSEIGTSGHEEFLMEERREGTKINYVYDVTLTNPILRLFGRFLIGKYALDFWEKAVINRLREIVEK